MIPYLVPVPASQSDVCKMATDVLISPVLAAKLVAMAGEYPLRLSIISGFRTRDHQLALAESGRPATDPDVSTHCSCPATGVDLRINGVSPGPYEKALLGEAAARVGLRWGGGSPAPEGIPTDWNHIDLGPRVQ
jgi:hypothetical protein